MLDVTPAPDSLLSLAPRVTSVIDVQGGIEPVVDGDVSLGLDDGWVIAITDPDLEQGIAGLLSPDSPAGKDLASRLGCSWSTSSLKDLRDMARSLVVESRSRRAATATALPSEDRDGARASLPRDVSMADLEAEMDRALAGHRVLGSRSVA